MCRAAAYLSALMVAGVFVVHLARGSSAYLGLFEDDYFYYAIIADNLVTTGKLTFDGVTLTNGFHPLWFVALLALRTVAGGLNEAFYALLAAAFLASMVATYELSRRFARALGASAALAPAAALAYAAPTFVVLSSGMETALDVPLLLAFFLEIARPAAITPRRAARLGALASLAILARLDIAMVVPLALAGWIALARPPGSLVARSLAAFCAAGAALPAYAAFNLLTFGSILPMSAAAKQLVTRPGINAGYLRVVATATPYGRLTGIVLVLGVFALLVLRRRRGAQPAQGSAPGLFAGGLALAFAALLFAVNTLSGWTYFGWYAYPLAPALVAALTFLGRVVGPRLSAAPRLRAGTAAITASAALATGDAAWYFASHGPLWSVEDNGLLAMSYQLGDRMRGREGVLGMGAIGGFAAYVARRPFVQLEGLVADRAMIDHLRRQDELGEVLAEYHVDYLVVSLHAARMEKRDGCYVLTQPHPEWAGRRVAKMRGELCAEPIEHFVTTAPKRPWSIFSPLETYVFDLRGARWRRAGDLRPPDPR